jgi:DNA-binding CsgD family transcriptional regulator
MARASNRVKNQGNLTRTQRRVVDLILAGRTTAEICEILDRAMYTVRNHVSAALHHYGVSNQAQLIAKLMRSQGPIRNRRYHELTPAQKRVVDLLAKGQSQAQIARRLRRSSFTIHNHIKAARETYGVRTQAQLLAKVLGSYRRSN